MFIFYLYIGYKLVCKGGKELVVLLIIYIYQQHTSFFFKIQSVIVFALISTFDTDTTFAPRLASNKEVVAPIPWPSSGGLPAPATTITLPDKSYIRYVIYDDDIYIYC